ncbi:MAG: alpha-hydroxy acid oxidase, partial [Alphaproteobacteria bacterium]
MNRSNKYPRLSDLAPAAQRKIPPFVFAYLDSGTGHDKAKDANRTLYDAISLTPQFLCGRVDPDISVSLLGKTYKAPFGVSPIGLASLIWPGAEQILAAAAKKNGFPFALSTVAGDSIERVSAVGGDMTWFQLYASHDKSLCFDLLRRAEECGCDTLVVTADVPSPSRRERMRIAGAPLGSRG